MIMPEKVETSFGDKNLPPAKAVLHRDSLAKILYARLFDEVLLPL